MKHLQEFLNQKNYTRVKLHLIKTNHFVIIAKINGVKGKFIVDTGASNTCVACAATNTFKLQIKSINIQAAGAGSNNLKAQLTKNNTLQIGAWKNTNQKIVVFNLQHVNEALASQNAQPVDGIIGADVLKKAKGIIDYNNKYLYLK